MVLIRWLDSFDIGIPDIDAEHRELVDLINAFHEALLDPANASDARDFLGAIYDRISAHFKHEELEMLAREFAEYWPHKGDHERLLDELRDMIAACNDHQPVDADALSIRLERWFSIHFRTFDARLHRMVEPSSGSNPNAQR